MAFLDNSGDIILDAVLTDTGRMRLAKGDGSFSITKFALGDDEINYALYDPEAPGGTPFFDIEIMQTPILEAFTNNTSGMHSKLMTLANNPGLYLPVILENQKDTNNQGNSTYGFLCAVDGQTQGGGPTKGRSFWEANSYSSNQEAGVIAGFDNNGGVSIRIDQGINSEEIAPSNHISAELYESQYLIEMDSRLAQLVSAETGGTTTLAAISFIDDDQIASYYVSQAVNSNFVKTNSDAGTASNYDQNVIAGPKGSVLTFSLRASLTLQTSTALFNKLGSTFVPGFLINTTTFYYIDSNIRVTGVSTGSVIDIPIRFIKWKSA